MLEQYEITEDKMSWSCRLHGTNNQYINILVGKLEGKSPLRRSRHEREDNIKVD
jgi:hypothetical protein